MIEKMTVFKKVLLKDRLPDSYEETFFITNDDDRTSGFLFKPDDCDPIVLNSGRDFSELEYWLEEIELPEIKDVGQEGSWCGCRDYDAGMNEILELFK